MVVGRVQRRSAGFFCAKCYEDAYWTHQTTNLLLGWWSVGAFLFTLALIPANAFARARGRRAATISASTAADSEEAARAERTGLWRERGSWFFGGAVVAALLAAACLTLIALQEKPRFGEEHMQRWALAIGAALAGGLSAWLCWCAFHPSSWSRMYKSATSPRTSAPPTVARVRRRPRRG
jgi:hypothetical protein